MRHVKSVIIGVKGQRVFSKEKRVLRNNEVIDEEQGQVLFVK